MGHRATGCILRTDGHSSVRAARRQADEEKQEDMRLARESAEYAQDPDAADFMSSAIGARPASQASQPPRRPQPPRPLPRASFFRRGRGRRPQTHLTGPVGALSGQDQAPASRASRGGGFRAHRIVSRDADEASGGRTTDMTSLGTAKFWGLSHAQDTPRRN